MVASYSVSDDVKDIWVEIALTVLNSKLRLVTHPPTEVEG